MTVRPLSSVVSWRTRRSASAGEVCARAPAAASAKARPKLNRMARQGMMLGARGQTAVTGSLRCDRDKGGVVHAGHDKLAAGGIAERVERNRSGDTVKGIR